MKVKIEHIKNICGSQLTVLMGEFMALNTYISKEEKSEINDLSSHIKNIEKEEETKLKTSSRKETIKSRSQ